MSTTAMNNIAALLPERARTQPDTLAVAWPEKPKGTTRYQRLSYRELEDQSNTLAHQLRAAGITKGTRVALLVPPCHSFFLLVFALLKAGAVMVCIDPGIGIKNMGQCLAEADVDAFVGIRKAHIARVLFRWCKKPGLKKFSVDGLFPGCFNINKLPIPISQEALLDTTTDDDAALLFTSGSTGVPKGVVYTHGHFCAQVEALRGAFNITPGEVDCATFPLFALFAPALGMSAVVPQMDFTRPAQVHPPALKRCLDEFAVTNLFGSPALLNTFGRWAEKEAWHFPALKRVVSAGAPVHATVIERILRLVNDGVQVWTPYGATECLPVAVYSSDEILSDTQQGTASGKGICVGPPVPSIEATIIPISDEPIANWSQAGTCPTGTVGEICVAGPQATASYWRREEATAQAKIAHPTHGFVHRMGDLGWIDDAGRLWFCGRKAHRVITTDRTYYSVACEGIFNQHPGVFRTALVQLDIAGHSEPGICIEREPQASSDTSNLFADLTKLASEHEATQGIQRFFIHPSFPVDIRHNAKINRERLGQWAQRQL